MKMFKFFVVFFSMLLFANFQYGVAMYKENDFNQMDTDGMAWLGIQPSNTITAVNSNPSDSMGLPLELLPHILEQITLCSAFDIARLIRLRQVCKVWLVVLTNEFVVRGRDLCLQRDKALYELCDIKKLLGKGLAAKCARFCMRTLWPEQAHTVMVKYLRWLVEKNNLFLSEKREYYFLNINVEYIRKLFELNSERQECVAFNIQEEVLSQLESFTFKNVDDQHEVIKAICFSIFKFCEHELLPVVAKAYITTIKLISNNEKPTILSLWIAENKGKLDLHERMFKEICLSSRNGYKRGQGYCLENFLTKDVDDLIDTCLQQLSYKQLFAIAADNCSAPMLSKLLDKADHADIDVTDLIRLVSRGYCRLVEECKASEDISVAHFQAGTGEHTNALSNQLAINPFQCLLDCELVLKQSNKCIFPQDSDGDEELERVFQALEVARKVVAAHEAF